MLNEPAFIVSVVTIASLSKVPDKVNTPAPRNDTFPAGTETV
jgi:hypothetical protein